LKILWGKCLVRMEENIFTRIWVNFWRFTGKTKLAHWGFPRLRRIVLYYGILTHSGKQRFYICKLNKKLLKKFADYLKKKGYEKDRYAWVDSGELFSLRKINKKIYQYHIRIFKNREIHGHYEYAPDRRPLKHLESTNLRRKRKYFKKLVRDFKKEQNKS